MKTVERIATLKHIVTSEYFEEYKLILKGALTDNENLTLALISRGYLVFDIAEELQKTEETIKQYVKHIYDLFIILCLQDKNRLETKTIKHFNEHVKALEEYATRLYIDKEKGVSVNDKDFIEHLQEVAICTTFFRITHPLHFHIQLMYTAKRIIDNGDGTTTTEYDNETQCFIYEYNQFFYDLYDAFRKDLHNLDYTSKCSNLEALRRNSKQDLKPVKIVSKDTSDNFYKMLAERLSDACDIYQQAIMLLLEEIQAQVVAFPNNPVKLRREYEKEVEVEYTNKYGEKVTQKRKVKTTALKQVSSGIIKYFHCISNPKFNPANFAKPLEILDNVYTVPCGTLEIISPKDLIDFGMKYNLTERELTVVSLKCYGLGRKRVADIIGCTKDTVKTWDKRAFNKVLKVLQDNNEMQGVKAYKVS